ncbi:MAG: ribosomal protein S18-alanine N-acetyltransferase [Firmicutes bacterium]|nr:ribosomal protein S18-alanine N-acetyltransferase [Bacillota bacterium]
MQFCHVDSVALIEKTVYTSPWSVHSFVNEILDNGFAFYYVVLVDQEVAGYAGIWVILDEAHITTLAVSPPWQGKGFGRSLLEYIIAEAVNKGAIRMTLEVRVSNQPAQELYKKFGFVTYGVRPNYYPDEDALIMWLDHLPSITAAADKKQEDNTGQEALKSVGEQKK